jgi:hypothetical protein
VKGRLTAAGIALVAVLVSASAVAAPTERVTLEIERIYDRPNGYSRLRFSGVISSGAANEYVTVMHRRCSQRFATAVAGATTRAGGVWDAVQSESSPPVGSGTFRARWKRHLSKPLTFRPPLRIFLSRQGERRIRVAITGSEKLGGAFVELQRLAGGRWMGVRRVRLSLERPAGYVKSYWAVFAVRTRGLTMRVFVPAETAAPCYKPTASQTFPT